MDPKTFAKTWFANIDKQNWAGVEQMIDEKHRFHDPMTPAPVGKEEHLGMMKGMTAAFTGEHELMLVMAEGDHVAVSGRWKGTHTGEFNGIAATGNKVEFTFVDILHVVNGKVVKEHFELNSMVFMQQIGAMPAMAAM